MNKFLELGRKAMFYVRVLSGYEERRIRNYRLMLEKRLQKAQEEKEAIRQIPEKVVLSEIRRMVVDMQKLNKTLEQTEKAIEQYFKPIDKQAEFLIKMQLDSEEDTMSEMAKTMQAQAMQAQAMQAQAVHEKSKALTDENMKDADTHQCDQESESTTKQHAEMR